MRHLIWSSTMALALGLALLCSPDAVWAQQGSGTLDTSRFSYNRPSARHYYHRPPVGQPYYPGSYVPGRNYTVYVPRGYIHYYPGVAYWPRTT